MKKRETKRHQPKSSERQPYGSEVLVLSRTGVEQSSLKGK